MARKKAKKKQATKRQKEQGQQQSKDQRSKSPQDKTQRSKRIRPKTPPKRNTKSMRQHTQMPQKPRRKRQKRSICSKEAGQSKSMREQTKRPKVLNRRPKTPKPTQMECKQNEMSEREKTTKKTRVTESFKHWLAIIIKQGVNGIKEEFHSIRSYCPTNFGQQEFQKNPSKNRYKDVICMDETRVKLLDQEDVVKNDYIHASNVTMTGGQIKFICTQGPTDETTIDFWRMIWQEGTELILMLCDLYEQGKPKCSEYWPRKDKENKVVGQFLIHNQSVSEVELAERQVVYISKLIIRNFRTNKSMEIWHYRWSGWPDKSIPLNGRPALMLLEKTRQLWNGKPVVVHCSAGIGRTGTLIALYMCMERLNTNQQLVVSDVLRQLRNQRLHSVQTDLQYLFIYRTLMEYYNDIQQIPISAQLGTFLLDYRNLLDAAP